MKSIYRFTAYSLVGFAVYLLPWIPLPFWKPMVLHDIFGSREFAVARFGVFFVGAFAAVIMLAWFLALGLKRRSWKFRLLFEVVSIPAIFAVLAYSSIGMELIAPSAQMISNLNRSRDQSAFINPYLGYTQHDCRTFTTEFDTVFIPSRLLIETDFVSYAPRREREFGYTDGRRDLGDGWFNDIQGSMSDPELERCLAVSPKGVSG